MRFISAKGAAYEGLLVYRASEYSLDFIRSQQFDLDHATGNLGTASLSIGTLQLEVSLSSGEILFPWGLFPSSHWKERELSSPNAIPGRVIFLDASSQMVKGGALSISETLSRETSIDPNSGWIRIGDDVGLGEAIEFANNAILVLENQAICGLWLKPVFN